MGGPCTLYTDKPVVQSCTCCPRGFCQNHAVMEARHESAPVTSTAARLFICEFCQANERRVGVSLVHRQLLGSGYTSQDLYTASGSHVSLYRYGIYPACSPKDFSAQCFEWDLTAFKDQVGVKTTSVRCRLGAMTFPMCTGQRLRAMGGSRSVPRPDVLASCRQGLR